MKSYIYKLLGPSLILFSLSTHADNLPEDSQYYSIDILLTHSSDFFDVYESSDDIDPIGSFYGNENNSVTIGLNLPYHYAGNSNFGYYFNYKFNRFNIDTQDTTITSSDVHEMDLGTSVTGYNIYATVSGFYNFGDKIIENDDDSSFKIGLGIGVGYLKADGDIILTELATQPKIDIGISDFGFNYGIFFDYRYGPWVFRIDTFGTSVKQGEYYFEDISQSFQIGYSFKL